MTHNICFIQIKPWLHYDLEICCSIKPMENQIMFYNIKTGDYTPYFDQITQQLKKKRTCTQTIQPLIFHTHPLRSYSYPSFEDINQVLQLNIKGSFIVTNWGIWYMEKDIQSRIFDIPKNTVDKLYDILDDLGIETHNSQYTEKNNKHKSIFYGKKVEHQIKKFLKKYHKLNIPLNIHFICWHCHQDNKILLDTHYNWIKI